MMEVKKLLFDDFQKMLVEVEGKPIYYESTAGFTLQWSGGGFLYQTEVSIVDIKESFLQETGINDEDKAVTLFKERYLKNCYRYYDKVPSTQKIKLVAPPVMAHESASYSFLREKNPREFVMGSFFVQTIRGVHFVKGKTKDGKIAVMGRLDKQQLNSLHK